MKQTIRAFVRKSVPALPKVLRSEFGDRAILRSAALFFVSLGIILLTLAGFRHPTGRIMPVAASGFECILLWRLGAFEIFGQILCACGVMQASVSNTGQARKYFHAALILLRDRHRAYEGLYQMAETGEAMRTLARLMQARERRLSQDVALLIARCLRDGEEVKAAIPYYEIADKLAPSDSVKLELAGMYLTIEAAAECLRMVQSITRLNANSQAFFLRASALRMLGRPAEAILWANRAVQARPCNSDYQMEKGRILECLGRNQAAGRQYGKAIRVHPRNPEAFFRRALLRLNAGDKAGAVQDLEQCYYYDNTRSHAYLLARALGTAESSTPSSLIERENPTLLIVDQSDYSLSKGQKVSIQFTVAADRRLDDCRVHVLEPFGWGLEVTSRCVILGGVSPGQRRTVSFEVKAKRASEVNLNRPWVLNVILTAHDSWTSRLLRFSVTDQEPGRVFLVLTNDHELRSHRERITPAGLCPVPPSEAMADLVKKGRLAADLAEKYALKWTFMLDAGAAIGLPKWASSQSPSWRQVYHEATKFCLDSQGKGHDCQLHLHLKAVPESSVFCYRHDLSKDVVSFDLQKHNRHFAGARVNSWANVTRTYGRPTDIRSRVGSIAHAAGAVTNLLSSQLPFHQPVLFRAGQWDIGASIAEREKSIMALRECGILADSSVTDGYNCYERPFRFGCPPARATYFTFRNNPEERARSLVDAGILQAVPILLRQGGHAMTPRDDPRPVIHAYRGFLQGNCVAPGRHLIMEIEHFCDIRDENDAGTRAWNASWRSMEHHFAEVRSKCPALEGVGGAEAIYAWLEYYSPELVLKLAAPTVRVDPATGDWQVLRFPVRFLGDGILTDDGREHNLALPLPSFGDDQPQVVRLFEATRIVFEGRYSPRSVLSVRLGLSQRNRHEFALEIQRNSDTFCKATSAPHRKSPQE
jgi:tetratricopeptide (TPR) repeat protein